ncbi:MAG: electron transfer flavoprotein beta subunit/FixA family protein [Desulfobacteraceae bacterium]|nr:MAG: electron transfer flavoprotein beta subunit/FixA family protein [Desulfobacteraceae bacterium]
MYHIIVCMKIVPDPEMPFSIFKVDRENRKPIPPAGSQPVVSPFDENALEAALRIKDRRECRVTVLSMGKAVPRAILQKTLAMGADDVIPIEGAELENLGGFSTAHALSCAIRRLAPYDLVFTGRQAADWDGGIVWAGIAEHLDLPSVTIARKAEIADGRVIVERCASDGIETVEADMPAIVTFSSEVGETRNVSIQALMKVKKRNIVKWAAEDLGFEKMETMELAELYEPDLGLIDCCLIPGDTAEEKGRNLARMLFQENILHQ